MYFRNSSGSHFYIVFRGLIIWVAKMAAGWSVFPEVFWQPASNRFGEVCWKESWEGWQMKYASWYFFWLPCPFGFARPVQQVCKWADKNMSWIVRFVVTSLHHEVGPGRNRLKSSGRVSSQVTCFSEVRSFELQKWLPEEMYFSGILLAAILHAF